MVPTAGWRSAVPLVEETAALLRERIFDGRYAPGARLPQAELSAELSLSRTPLREALRLLEEQGLVRADDRGGARVSTMGPEEVLAALEFREAVEGLAARLACDRLAAVRGVSSATPPALAELRELAAAEAHELLPGRERRFALLSGRFHESLLRASGNSFVLRQSGVIRLTEKLLQADCPLHTRGCGGRAGRTCRPRRRAGTWKRGRRRTACPRTAARRSRPDPPRHDPIRIIRSRSPMRTHKIAVIRGDGIGPEVIEALLAVLDAAESAFGFSTERTEGPWQPGPSTICALQNCGPRSCRGGCGVRTRSSLAQWETRPCHREFWSVASSEMRRTFQQAVNLRPVKLTTVSRRPSPGLHPSDAT